MKTTRWTPADAGSTAGAGSAAGPAGGDLGGGYPAPTVTGLDGKPFSAPGTETNGVVPTYNAGTGKWDFASGTSGLEVKEVDGSPDVTGVSLIEVPNGSLTSLGGGGVSLGYMVNPMSAYGDIIYGVASGVPTALGAGTVGYVLSSNGVGAAPSWVLSAGGGGGGLTGYEATIVTDRPRIYFPMQDPSGTFLQDLSGGNHNGYMNGHASATFQVGSGPVATFPDSITFDGTNAWALFDQYSWDDLWAKSVEFWFKTSSAATMYVNQKRGTCSISTLMGLDGAGHGAAGDMHIVADTGGVAIGIHTTSTYNDNAWHYFVGTWEADNGTAIATGQFTIYIDGSVAATAGGTTGAHNSPAQEDAAGTLGSAGGGTNKWNGGLCHFAVYDYVLSSAQVSAHYAARL